MKRKQDCRPNAERKVARLLSRERDKGSMLIEKRKSIISTWKMLVAQSLKMKGNLDINQANRY